MASSYDDIVANVSRRFGVTLDRIEQEHPLDEDSWKTTTSDDAKNLSVAGGVTRTQGSCSTVRFRPQDVEPLLDQATSILDRALSDRVTWHNMGEKWATLRLDVFQSRHLERIAELEEQQGRFDYEAALAAGQKDAADAKIDGLG